MKNEKNYIRKIFIIIVFLVICGIISNRIITKKNQVKIQEISKAVVEQSENLEILNLIDEFGNEDIKGYLNIDGTTINYPVVQTTDNEFYLHYDVYKEKSVAGSIYLDYENNIEIIDYNTVIYGHNMREDIMFHSLRNYNDQGFYEEHKYIEFTTLHNDFVYEIFSVYTASIDFPYINVVFESEEEFYKISKQFKENSIYDTGVEIDKHDKIITLSTCTPNSDADKRFVVQGKLISINGEEY